MERFWAFFDTNAAGAPVPAAYRELAYRPLGLFYPGLHGLGPDGAMAPEPFLAPESYEGLSELLRASAAAIKREALRLPAEAWEAQAGGTGWGMLALRELGRPTPESRRYGGRLPSTAGLLEALEGAGHLAPESVKLLRQAPGTGLSPHADSLNMLLCCHLGLSIPAAEGGAGAAGRPWLKCGGEVRRWAQGEATIFDQTFEHSTWNPTSEDRLVLALDLWHPELRSSERRALTVLFGFVDVWNARHGQDYGLHFPHGTSYSRTYDDGPQQTRHGSERKTALRRVAAALLVLDAGWWLQRFARDRR